MANEFKTTPLNGWHRRQGANMADFGGYNMPLWYETGVKKEHLSVLESVGIFDTTHMACVMVCGKDAFALLQLCHTRDLSNLNQGRCVYGAVLDENGNVIDDAIVYKFNDIDYMVCVNAGMGGTIASHLNYNKKNMSVEIDDLSDKLGKMDIQGKNSARILSQLIKNPEKIFDKMPYFSFKGHFDKSSPLSAKVRLKDDNIPVLLSRSGYTGEFGFEVFIDPEFIVKLWENILEIGEKYNITACGLGARDSLRTGAVLPLSHQDIGHWKFINHPWMFALPFNEEQIGFTKDFIGKDALLDAKIAKFTYPFAGENLRKVGSGEDSLVIDKNGNKIGKVLTCATDMGISWYNDKILSIATPCLPKNFKAKGISCGFVLVDKKLNYGEKLILQEGKRKIKVTILKDIRPDRTARKKLSNFI